MTSPILPIDLLDEIADLKRRVLELERSTTNSRQGQTFQDDQGRVRVRIGPHSGGSTHGITVYNAAGGVYFQQTTA